jgi:hypothetical protein
MRFFRIVPMPSKEGVPRYHRYFIYTIVHDLYRYFELLSFLDLLDCNFVVVVLKVFWNSMLRRFIANRRDRVTPRQSASMHPTCLPVQSLSFDAIFDNVPNAFFAHFRASIPFCCYIMALDAYLNFDISSDYHL